MFGIGWRGAINLVLQMVLQSYNGGRYGRGAVVFRNFVVNFVIIRVAPTRNMNFCGNICTATPPSYSICMASA